MALNANALITTDELAAHFGQSTPLDAPTTTRYEVIINAASQMIEKRIDRVVREQSYTEVFDGRKNGRMLLKEFPASALTEVRVDSDAVFDADSIQDLSRYRLANQIEVINLDGVFAKGRYNIQITYTAGYSETPSDLSYACLLMCEWLERFKSRQDIGRTTKSKQDEDTSVTQDVPSIILTLIEPYKRAELASATTGVYNN